MFFFYNLFIWKKKIIFVYLCVNFCSVFKLRLFLIEVRLEHTFSKMTDKNKTITCQKKYLTFVYYPMKILNVFDEKMH